MFWFYIKNSFVLIKYKIKSSKPHLLLHFTLSLFSPNSFSLSVCMTSSVYSTLLWILWLLLVKHFYVIGYICLTCIIVYDLLSWIILLFCVMDFFFFFTYLCYPFFFFLVTQVIYIYIKLTIMVINSKLVIGHYKSVCFYLTNLTIHFVGFN